MDFITTPKGEIVRKDAILAIRLGDPQEEDKEEYLTKLMPRVIIDYGKERYMNHVIIDTDSIEARDALAADLRKQLTE